MKRLHVPCTQCTNSLHTTCCSLQINRPSRSSDRLRWAWPVRCILYKVLSSKLLKLSVGGHRWRGICSWVSLSNNSIVARARWAFQFSQDSVETLFSWCSKHFHDFVANLVRKQCTKFHHNCQSFIGDITKKTFWCLFFWTECIYRIQHRIVCRGECWYPRRNDYI